jgi:hypothetical protein
MRYHTAITYTITLGLLLCFLSSVPQEIPEVYQEEMEGFMLNRNETFTGESLWGYMNGGADIYLEYGFDRMRVEEFSRGEEIIKLELFKMDDPIAAFGIYSIKTFKCLNNNLLMESDCLNKYQYQLLIGDYYIQLIDESGSGESEQTMVTIAEKVLNKLEPADLELPLKYLTDTLNIPLSEIKMVSGPVGVLNKMTLLEDYLKNVEGYKVFSAKKNIQGTSVNLYEIVFSNEEMRNKFLKNLQGTNYLVSVDDLNILLR